MLIVYYNIARINMLTKIREKINPSLKTGVIRFLEITAVVF